MFGLHSTVRGRILCLVVVHTVLFLRVRIGRKIRRRRDQLLASQEGSYLMLMSPLNGFIYYYIRPNNFTFISTFFSPFYSQHLPSLFKDLYIFTFLSLMEHIEIKYKQFLQFSY